MSGPNGPIDLLSDHTKEEIEHWKTRFPEGKQRSAVIGALHAVQHADRHPTIVDYSRGRVAVKCRTPPR